MGAGWRGGRKTQRRRLHTQPVLPASPDSWTSSSDAPTNTPAPNRALGPEDPRSAPVLDRALQSLSSGFQAALWTERPRPANSPQGDPSAFVLRSPPNPCSSLLTSAVCLFPPGFSRLELHLQVGAFVLCLPRRLRTCAKLSGTLALMAATMGYHKPLSSTDGSPGGHLSPSPISKPLALLPLPCGMLCRWTGPSASGAGAYTSVLKVKVLIILCPQLWGLIQIQKQQEKKAAFLIINRISIRSGTNREFAPMRGI